MFLFLYTYENYTNNFVCYFTNATSLYLLNQYSFTTRILPYSQILFTIVGRIILFRNIGTLLFLDLYDINYKIQVIINKKYFTDKIHISCCNNIKAGVFLQATGYIFVTAKKELSLFTINFFILKNSSKIY